ncbi:MAG: methyltransferase family protein [Anaerolineales bacterium]
MSAAGYSFLAILGALAGWGAFHSLTASLWAKARARGVLGARPTDGGYRLVYNIFAVATFAPVLALPGILPAAPFYKFPPGLPYLTIPLQFAALGGMGLSLWKVDLPRFLGLRQLVRWLRGEADPRDPPQFVATGIHRLVRHPLYFFSLVFIWLTPVMTTNVLAFNLGVTLYFWLGSVFEERKLVRDFGDAYREHQRTVPRLLPLRLPHAR